MRLVPTEHATAATQAIDGHYTIDLERKNDTWHIRSIRHDEGGAAVSPVIGDANC